MLRIPFFAVFLVIALQSASQVKFSDAEILVQSRHLWRGEELGTAPAIEPSVTFLSGRLSFNFWAAVTPDNSYSEIDLIPSFRFNNFSLTLLDYYNPVVAERNQYLSFQEGKNRHSLELNIDNYSIDYHRFKWLVGTFIFGDKNEGTNRPYYSTYIEFKYPFTVLSIDAEPFIGTTPFKGLYAGTFAIVHTGITFGKEFDLKLPFTIPINLSFTTNPHAKKSFVTFGAGIAF